MVDPSSWPTDAVGLRALMPRADGRINLNAGTLSPTPAPVQAATDALRAEQSTNGYHFFSRASVPILKSARLALADYLNADESLTLLLPNVTSAMNLAIFSVPLSAGDEVIITDHCYGAMRLAMEYRAKELGATIVTVTVPPNPPSPEWVVEAIESAMTDRTRCLLLDHISSPGGLCFPVTALCDLARAKGLWSIVDGAHAPGLIPVDVTNIGADYYGANCHKWMMSAPGCGFLTCSPRGAEALRPRVLSWGEDFRDMGPGDDCGLGSSTWQRRFEYQGMIDRCPQLSLPTAIAFGRHVDEHVGIATTSGDLAAFCKTKLGELGLRSMSPEHPELATPMVLFEVDVDPESPGNPPPWCAAGVEAPVTRLQNHRMVRVSCAWWNTEADIDALAEAISRRGQTP